MKLQVVRKRNSYAVKGGSGGWIFTKTFPTRWKAKLAISVFQRGGKASDYWNEARKGRKRRPDNSPLGKARSRLRMDPKDPEAHLDLAVALLSRSVPTVANPVSSFYDNVTPFPSALEDLGTAKDHLLLSLALRPSNRKTAAKARYILLSIELRQLQVAGSGEGLSDANVPIIHSLVVDALEDIRFNSRRSADDVEAMRIQRALMAFLGDRDGEARAMLAVEQAKALAKAGLIHKGPQATRVRSRNRRSDGIQLELEVQALMRNYGLEAQTTQMSNDGGIDIIAFSNQPMFAGKYIVQCKDWSKPVGEPIVRDLYGLVLHEGANKGILVTSGAFSPAAYRFAQGKPLELIDGEGMRALVKTRD